jgi:hypothetical protein
MLKSDLVQIIILAILCILVIFIASVQANPLENKVILDQIKEAGFVQISPGIYKCEVNGGEIIEYLRIKVHPSGYMIRYEILNFPADWFVYLENKDLISEDLVEKNISKYIKDLRKIAKETIDEQIKKELKSRGAKEA